MRRPRAPSLVVRNGKPVGVMLDIDVYEELLRKLGDTEALGYLNKMRERPPRFGSLQDVLDNYSQR